MLSQVPEPALKCVSAYVFSRPLLIDRVSQISSVFEVDPTRGDYKDKPWNALARAKTLKGLKTKNPDRDARGCPMCADL